MRARTITATLLAALSVGVAMAPAAEAAPNDGRYHKSAEGMKRKFDCGASKGLYDALMTDARRLAAKGYTASAANSAQEAKDERLDAKQNGCGWAA